MTADRSGDGAETVNAFRIEDAYCLRHYFEGEAVFARLRQYYENAQYRFVVPAREFDGVRRFLANHGYRLRPVTDLARYTVAVRQYTAHPEIVFAAAVDQRRREGFTLFVLNDRAAVEAAVDDGAMRLADAPVTTEESGQQRLTAV